MLMPVVFSVIVTPLPLVSFFYSDVFFGVTLLTSRRCLCTLRVATPAWEAAHLPSTLRGLMLPNAASARCAFERQQLQSVVLSVLETCICLLLSGGGSVLVWCAGVEAPGLMRIFAVVHVFCVRTATLHSVLRSLWKLHKVHTASNKTR